MGALAIYIISIMAILPFTVLYAVSDWLLYPLVRYVMRYRRSVVEKNLMLAFPEKDNRERMKIEQLFYHHLCDVFVESVKLCHMSEKELKQRFLWENYDEVMSSATNERRMTLCYFAHYANWEWAMGMFMPKGTTTLIIYQKLHNPVFDKWICNNRSRFGAIPIEMSSVSETLRVYNTLREKCIVLAIADQLPKEQYVRHFYKFMGIKTKVLTGTESMIRKYNMNVFYCSVKRKERGYYVCKAERLDFPNQCKNDAWPYTEAFFERLQQQIGESPELWLWSHDRWRR